jgi:hypothetical protein
LGRATAAPFVVKPLVNDGELLDDDVLLCVGAANTDDMLGEPNEPSGVLLLLLLSAIIARKMRKLCLTYVCRPYLARENFWRGYFARG